MAVMAESPESKPHGNWRQRTRRRMGYVALAGALAAVGGTLVNLRESSKDTVKVNDTVVRIAVDATKGGIIFAFGAISARKLLEED